MKRKIKEFNLEKVSAYLGVIVILISFWQSQLNLKDNIADLKERIAKLEVKAEMIKEKKNDS